MILTPSKDIDEWHLQRWGRFTSSENHRLLSPTGGMKMFTAGAMTYITEKVLQMTTRMVERPELDQVESLLHGKMYELPAFQEYVRVTRNTDLMHIDEEHPLFLECPVMAKDCGGSPDAIHITSDFKVDKGVEIKCPKNPMNHFKRLTWKTMWDVKEGYPSCYTQIQDLMRITGASSWDFVSYDERQLRKDKKAKIIEILPDRKYQDNLEIVLRMAVKEKYRIYDEYMNA